MGKGDPSPPERSHSFTSAQTPVHRFIPLTLTPPFGLPPSVLPPILRPLCAIKVQTLSFPTPSTLASVRLVPLIRRTTSYSFLPEGDEKDHFLLVCCNLPPHLLITIINTAA
eukprot:Sspe_Gene.44867::Locus_22078_Transcript_1_1_Confidence_1.000_Length_480::g.44867::m.44867